MCELDLGNGQTLHLGMMSEVKVIWRSMYRTLTITRRARMTVHFENARFARSGALYCSSTVRQRCDHHCRRYTWVSLLIFFTRSFSSMPNDAFVFVNPT